MDGIPQIESAAVSGIQYALVSCSGHSSFCQLQTVDVLRDGVHFVDAGGSVICLAEDIVLPGAFRGADIFFFGQFSYFLFFPAYR